LEVPVFHIPLPDLSNQLSPLFPKGPARSQINHPTITIDLERDQGLNLVSESLHSISTITYHLSIA
jgi:hypothetical protein